ncbi:hypothetical protein EVAR_66065_1 [Eumeta japonica]|uniref:Uncharacterized protein n=1 Tax=Eumeta variegata TaxID=151549 RepID=A0A4C1ZJT7_EUMVA|nr:hypothetical protein EVAR_66065_1 [Eumeta japonica]
MARGRLLAPQRQSGVTTSPSQFGPWEYIDKCTKIGKNNYLTSVGGHKMNAYNDSFQLTPPSTMIPILFQLNSNPDPAFDFDSGLDLDSVLSKI